MKFIFFVFLFFQINSSNFEINRLYPDITNSIPLYKTINTYFYFDTETFVLYDDIYLYLEDESFFINYVAICYINSSSTIDKCNFNTINHYNYRNSTYKEIFQYFYKIPCKKDYEYIIIQYKAKYPGILKAEISKYDLFDREQKKEKSTPIPIGSIIGISILALLDLCIYFFVIPVFCYLIIKSKKISGNVPSQPSLNNNISNEPLAQPDEISQNIQNQEQKQNDTPIINNEN